MTDILNDTICAISTAPGVGGIAVARISGPKAINICDKIWKGKPLREAKTHTAHLGEIILADGSVLDQAVATIFRAPGSYTGEDTVELSVHGSRWIQRELINRLIAAGARPAEAGEFTRRAFACGHLDLAQAEAVADLIASSSRASHRIAMNQMRGSVSSRIGELRQELVEMASLLELELDFSEEDVEFASRERLRELATDISKEIRRLTDSFRSGSAIKDGVPVAIIGHTNAGKSSLLNMLVGDERAIVSDIHGTTRDIVEDTIEIGDYLVRFQDTAGLRETDDKIERIGIDRSIDAARKAEIVLYVADSTNPPSAEELDQELNDTDKAHTIFVLNKCDLSGRQYVMPEGFDTVEISALTGEGLDALKSAIERHLKDLNGNSEDHVLITNARHMAALTAAQDSISAVISGLDSGISTDFVAQDLREALHHISTITGTITTQEILTTIFSKFCIGK